MEKFGEFGEFGEKWLCPVDGPQAAGTEKSYVGREHVRGDESRAAPRYLYDPERKTLDEKRTREKP